MAPRPRRAYYRGMKKLLQCAVVLCALATPALAEDERSPIVYNLRGHMVGVIQRDAPNGDVIMLPSKATLDLGYYDVAVPRQALRPRARGGWETTLTNDQIAYLEPVPHQFFMPSGD
jgi:hypothetical protein